MEGDGARAVCGRVSGVGLVDGRSSSRLPDMTVSADTIRRKTVGREITFVFACFSSSFFIITLVSFNEHADLRQVNVRVEIVNEPKRDRMIFTVARRDETRCTVIKPLTYSMFRR